jgi:hypothetical protein
MGVVSADAFPTVDWVTLRPRRSAPGMQLTGLDGIALQERAPLEPL